MLSLILSEMFRYTALRAKSRTTRTLMTRGVTPTEVELQILRVLWELGPSPVREIHRRLNAAKGTNYSTTVKMLAVMLDKGLVKRNESARPHVYRAASSQEQTQKQMLARLIDKAYNGSAMSL